MYSIVLTNGKIINIEATEVEWCEKDRMPKLMTKSLDGKKKLIARINMDNIVGWIDTNYIVEREEA